MFKNKKTVLALELLVVAFAIYKFSHLVRYYNDQKTSDAINLEARQLIEEDFKIEDKSNFSSSSGSIKERTMKYEDMYPDYVAYISIPGTNISYVVVQADDNDYYLDHAIDKTYHGNGSIFLDYRNDGFEDENTVVYGHYIKSGKFFYELDKFKDQDFYDEYNKIFIENNEGLYEYTIYSVYIAEPEEDYRSPNFDSIDAKEDFLRSTKDRSMVEGPDLGEDLATAKIISLSTCSNRGKKRLVVHGIRSN